MHRAHRRGASPEVILFDEPCSALDPISTAKIEELIDELKQDYTIVIVTHNMQQAARVSDFTAFMYLGELIEFGTDPEDLHRARRPAHRRTTSPAGSAERQACEQATTQRDDTNTPSRPSTMRPAGARPHGRARWAAWPRSSSRSGRRARSKRDAELRRARHRARSPPIDQLQHDIEEKAIPMIARRQPMAIDLRADRVALRIANDLERIGDLAKNIAKRVIAIGGRPPSAKLIASGLEHMVDTGARSAQGACSPPIAARDVDKALAVWNARRARSTRMHTSLFRELLTYMMEDPRNIGFCTHLLFCAKNLERIGDHATNIAETVHYMITGELSRERPKGDKSRRAAAGSTA